MKFDFLGLTTLTILDWAERYRARLGEPDFSLEKIPLDDAGSLQAALRAATPPRCSSWNRAACAT